ncbi:MAG TPA: hypothetical protein VHT91_19265 [Kofleriaceae bacterium]|jgi:hypothetical protein|nr:hypothetical protein [Kofleriaceae bacterium]
MNAQSCVYPTSHRSIAHATSPPGPGGTPAGSPAIALDRSLSLTGPSHCMDSHQEDAMDKEDVKKKVDEAAQQSADKAKAAGAAAESTGEKAKQAGQQAAQTAGEKMQEAKESMKEKLEEAGEKVKEGAENLGTQIKGKLEK